MIPSYFEQMNSLPHTPNGKIDRKKLPNPTLKKTSKKIIEPRNELDKKIILILEKLLNQKNISLDDSFIELGGDSLLAISLCAIVQSEFNAKISVKDILDNPTIQSLSDLIYRNTGTSNTVTIKKIPLADYYNLSSAQERMYYSSKAAGSNSILYNIPGAVIIDKILDSTRLEKCFNKIIARHESLRTYFTIYQNKVVQKIKKEINFNLETQEDIEFSDFDTIFADFIKPFDLEQAPLFRAKLIKFTNQKCAILLDLHHIISDGQSVSILINEVCKLYNNLETDLPNLDFTYKDLSSILTNDNFIKNYHEAEEYWLKKFEKEIPVLNMPTKVVRPAIQSFDGMRVYQNLNSITFNKIINLAKNLNVTPYMILLCTYYILLSKYSGQEDIIIGTPSAGRELEETQNIIGMFVNTIPLKNTVNNNLSILDFLKKLKDNITTDFKYQVYPFNTLVEKLNIKRDSSRNPLFDVMFTYQSNGYENISINGAHATYYIPDTKTSKFDLSLEVVPLEDNYKLTFEFSSKLFSISFIEKLSENFINVLNNVLNNIKTKISDIELLSNDEKKKILYDFNNTQKNYPNKTFSTLFEEQVEKTPDKVALVFENKELTYNELNQKANSLAYYLRNTSKIQKEDLIGIMVNRSFEMIIAILAVMKVGGAYIPIDPKFPKDRIDYMLSSSHSKVLLTNKKLENKIDFHNKITIDLDNRNIYDLPNNNIENINTLDDLLYVIFTSGSTGKPKGVMQNRKNSC